MGTLEQLNNPLRIIGLVFCISLIGCIEGARLQVELPPEYLGPPPADLGQDIVETDADTSAPGDTSIADVPDGTQDTAQPDSQGPDLPDIGTDVCPPGVDCTPCLENVQCAALDDGNLCNGRWVCGPSSYCIEEPDPIECSAPVGGKTCHSYGCIASTGECGWTQLLDGTACDDGEACTSGDHCDRGGCIGGPKIFCDDKNECTLDTCVDGACAHVPNDGVECDDGNLCTTSDLCSGGTCGNIVSQCDCTEDSDCSQYDDGNACTGTVACINNQCQVDLGTIPVCTAGPCENAFCDASTGSCATEKAPDGTGCEDGDICTFGDTCSDGTCNAGEALKCGSPICGEAACGETGCAIVPPVEGEEETTCECKSNADCAAYEDNDSCNGTLICVAGSCEVDPSTVSDCAAAANNPCVSCEDTDGVCTVTTQTDGSSCDDGDACTENDTCESGTCQGQALQCQGDSICVAAMCHPLTGCLTVDVGRTCDDGNACTDEVCQAGTCSPFTEVTCPDPGACLSAACNPDDGKCVSTPEPGSCDDGSNCTEADTCDEGSCHGTAIFCDDGNPCTNESCDPATGCVSTPNNYLCDDGTDCTTGDVCTEGECKGAPGGCPCESTQECILFDDGNSCNGILNCVDGACVVNEDKVVVCDPAGNTPCLESKCQKESGECELVPRGDGAACNDGDVCTQIDVCAAGTCKGSDIPCDDGNDCTIDSCVPDTGCVSTPAEDQSDCNDGNSCTNVDFCQGGKCVGIPSGCECGSDDDCAVFEDGDLCSGTLRCVSGKCKLDTETIVSCPLTDDPCRESVCNPSTGACSLVNLADGSACEDGDACSTEDTCLAGNCTPGVLNDCNDDNPCTEGVCDAGSGNCNFLPVIGACDDGEECTSVDLCENGSCVGTSNSCFCQVDAQCLLQGLDLCKGKYECVNNGCQLKPGSAVNCDTEDDTACSFVTCEPTVGECLATSLTQGTECDDGNPCTVQNECNTEGECVGSPNPCDDGNPCTDNNCDPVSGCAPNPVAGGTECDDGDACTTDESCIDGQCQTLTPGCTCVTSNDCPQDDDLCIGDYKCLGGKCVKDADISCDTNPNPCRLNICEPETGQCVTINAPGDTTCTDGDLCTLDDSCYNGICTGNLNQCDDGKPCTIDSCSVGICQNEAAEDISCEDGDVCTKKDKCKDGECKAGTFVCSCLKDFQCAVFDDGNNCNGIWTCQNNKCAADPASEVICLDENPYDCSETFCNAALGQCFNKGLSDGDACNDGTICTQEDQCFQGNCIGTPPPPCKDNNSFDCIEPACHPITGQCADFPVTDGEECNDGDLCTDEESCVSGICSGTVVDCTDESPCTKDSCAPEIGCITTTLFGSCDDGDPCTADTTCVAGECQAGSASCGCETDTDCESFKADACSAEWTCVNSVCTEQPDTAVTCDPSEDVCLVNACDPESGECATTNAADHIGCDDGDTCTLEDQCLSGACAGSPLDCDDNNSCTTDTCTDGACAQEVATNGAPCDDGIACNGTDTCAGGACITDGEPACGCTTDADCTPFEDGNLCTGTLVCTDSGQCATDLSTVVGCSDPVDGCGTAACNPETGACVITGRPDNTACDDDNRCTYGDACKGGVCTGIAKDCNDEKPCTADSCDEDFGCLNLILAGPCDDGNPCTINEVCAKGKCEGEVNPCDDGNDCTIDGCQDQSGCAYVNKSPVFGCDDGTTCTTNDKCDGKGGCKGLNLCACTEDADCAAEDDGNKCLGPLFCVDNGCVRDPSLKVTCPEGNQCLDSSCDVATGECTTAPINEGLDCEDDNACTDATVCTAGLCEGTAVTCDDTNPCKPFICVKTTGCEPSEATGPCNDGSSCTDNDHCADGTCKGTPIDSLDTGFETGTADAWEFTSTGVDAGWGVLAFQPFAGTYALYGGNPKTGTMADTGGGTWLATAKLPIISLGPDTGDAALEFLLYLDVEDQACNADFLSVKIDGAQAFSRCDSTGGTFVPVSVDLGFFAPGELEVEIVLNTVTGDANGGVGAIIDNVRITRTCVEVP